MRPIQRKRSGRRRRGEAGAVAAEFAIVIFLVLAVVIGMMDLGLMYWNWSAMQLAADEGARYAMVTYGAENLSERCQGTNPTLEDCTKEAMRNAIRSYFGFLFVTYSNGFQAKCYDASGSAVACSSGTPTTLKVRVAGTFHFLPIPGPLGSAGSAKFTIPLVAGTTVPLVIVGSGTPP